MSTDKPPFWRDSYFWLAVALSVFAVGPLLQPEYHWGAHDARHGVYFLYEFDRAIQDGVLYPRWAPDFAFGYGYPFFNIYGPLSSYMGEAFHLAGFGYVASVKIVFGVSVLLSSAAMYLFARRLMGRRAGFVAALVYVYVPYHLFDLYVRAALAESVGFVFIPLAFWGFYEVTTRPSFKSTLLTAIAYAGLMFTSNLLALLVTPILGLFVLVLMLRREGGGARGFVKSGMPPALALAWGLGLSAIFWLPMVLEYRYVRVDQWVGGRYAFGGDFVEFFQLFSPRWGFGASIPGPDDDLGFQLGAVPLVLFALSFWLAPRLQERPARRAMFFFQALTIAAVFLMLPASEWLWRALPLSSFAQFPWRLLVLTAGPLALLSGLALADDVAGKKPPPLLMPLFAALVILGSYPYLQAQSRPPRPTEGPVSLEALFRFQQSSDEMTGQTAWVKEIPRWSALAEEVIEGHEITTKVDYGRVPPDNSLGVHSVEMDSIHELLWVYAADETKSVTFMVPYYPGWRAYVYEDLGEHLKVSDLRERVGALAETPPIGVTEPEGWMVVPIPEGPHFLELRFEDTPPRTGGKAVSALSLLAAVALPIYPHLHRVFHVKRAKRGAAQ